MADNFSSRLALVRTRFRNRKFVSAHESLAVLDLAGVNSIDALTKLVADRGAPATLRTSAAWLLGQLRERQAVPVLLRMLTESKAHEFTCAAMRALGSISDKTSVPSLISLLQSRRRSVDVRMGAAYALGYIGDRRATPVLISVLQNVRMCPRLRDQAAEALGLLYDKRSMQPLMAALFDADPGVRASAANSLGEIGAIPALSALKTLTRKSSESDPLVRRLAREAVATLEERRRRIGDVGPRRPS